MRRQIYREIIILFFLGAIFLFFIGCQGTSLVISSGSPPERHPGYEKEGPPPPWAPAHGYRAKYRYYYYPTARVYHDRERGLYFYYRDGEWKISVSLPVWIRIDVNESVTLEMDSDRPYKYHAEVEKRYPPGQLKQKNRVKKK